MRFFLRAAGAGVVALLFVAPGTVGAQSEQPMILALPHDDEVSALYWPVGTDVTLKIDDPGNAAGVDYENTLTASPAEFDQHVTLASFELDGAFDLRAGHKITVTDGITMRQHTVTDVSVTDVDLDGDTVSGTAASGNEVSVEVWRAPLWWYASRTKTVDGSGTWAADFSVPDDEPHQGALAHDITRATYGAAIDWDDEPGPYRDGTLVFWPFDSGNEAHVPLIEVNPSEELIVARSWPFGAEVTLTIAAPGLASGGYTEMATVGEAQLDPGQTYAEFPLSGVFDVRVGQVVIVSDGVTAKSLTVTAGTITAIDEEGDGLFGSAAPGSDIDVEISVPFLGVVANRHETADASGDWEADFSTPGSDAGDYGVADVAYDRNIRAFVTERDEDGDATVTEVFVAPGSGDANCDGDISSIDALVILRSVAGLPVNLPPGCPAIGMY